MSNKVKYIIFDPNKSCELVSPPLYIEQEIDRAYNNAVKRYGKIKVVNNLNMHCCQPSMDDEDWVFIDNKNIIFYPYGSISSTGVQPVAGISKSIHGDEDFVLRYEFNNYPYYLDVPILKELPIPVEWRSNISPIWFCAENNTVNTICMDTFYEIFAEHSNFKPLPLEISIKLEESYQCGNNVVIIENLSQKTKYSVSCKFLSNDCIGIKLANDGSYRYIYRFLITNEQYKEMISEFNYDNSTYTNETII